MKCPACGAENEEDAKFCKLCWKPFQDGKPTLEQLAGRSSIPDEKEPEDLHDTNLDSQAKIDYKKFGADPDHYIKDFMPAWKRYVLFNRIMAAVLILWIMYLFTHLSEIDSLTDVTIFLGIALFVLFVYVSSKLKCPNCSCNIFWYEYRKHWGLTTPMNVLRDRKCPRCGVKLKT